jgi:hypothetical protein
MWLALLVFPLGFCSLFEAAQVLTKSSSTGSLLRYYRSFLLQVYDLVNIDLLSAIVRQVHADAESNAPDPKAKFLQRIEILSYHLPQWTSFTYLLPDVPGR